MRSQNRKVNSAGKVSCLLLLVLTFLAVNPVAGSVYAEEDLAVQSDQITSVVNFSFGEPVGVTSLTPVSNDGASAKYSIQAKVSVENSGGYTVYLGSSKSELTGKNTGTTINPVTGSSSYEELPKNTWGYNAVEGETAGDGFQAIPTNSRGNIIGENTSSNIKSDEKTFTLSFATHIGNDKPADIYENEVTMSVVSSPLEISDLTGLVNMQDMTGEVCEASAVGDTVQLKDVCDGKYYWVAKLADNKCWMTQNLALDITEAGLSAQDTDISEDWNEVSSYPPENYETSISQATVGASQTATRSWDFGSFVISSPISNSSCGTGKTGLAVCNAQFLATAAREASKLPGFYDEKKASYTSTEYDAHYLTGNYYQWNTATAGTGGVITSGEAAGSICPKGWRLPTAGGATGDFSELVSAGNITDTTKLVAPPYYFVRGGYVNQNSTIFGYGGDYGRYWSSTPDTNKDYAYYLYFSGANRIIPSTNDNRRHGYSVRCIAR